LVVLMLATASTFAQDRAAHPDSASVKESERLLSESAKAYRDAPALTDTIAIEVRTPDGQSSSQMTLAFGANDRASAEIQGTTMTIADGRFTLVQEQNAEKYISVKIAGDPLSAIDRAMGPSGFIPPLFGMRFSRDQQQQLDILTMRQLKNAKVSEAHVAEAGATSETISLVADNGVSTIELDPKTKLVRRVHVEFTPAGAPADVPEVKAAVTLTMSPAVVQELPGMAVANPGKRRAVPDVVSMSPGPSVGDEAPDFTLPTLGGQSITLSSLKGSVVVLDFWATWCQPCKRGLPLLQEFANWAEKSGKPIKVFAVDVKERETDPDAIKAKVKAFWTKQGYSIQTLLDLDQSVAAKYFVPPIPVTMIVGADGRITAIHRQFDPDMVEILKRDTQEAMATAPSESKGK